MNSITQKITEACAATQPRTPARNKALKSVRWVLLCASGYAALTHDVRCIVVEDIASAQVFDGRDNETLKARYWSVQLGEDCQPLLLP